MNTQSGPPAKLDGMEILPVRLILNLYLPPLMCTYLCPSDEQPGNVSRSVLQYRRLE